MDVENRSVGRRLAGRLGLGQLLPETRQGYILICVALWSTISFLVAQQWVVKSVVVQGKSMMPTLKPGDCRFVNCLLPHFRDYKRGDIVVIRDPASNEFIVKRIVGMPHDHVQVRSGRVYVNDQLLPEPYLGLGTETTSGWLRDQVVTIKDSSYFVMGDNRAESDDSRFFGDVNRHDLMGIIFR
jgi:signal peptidase I